MIRVTCLTCGKILTAPAEAAGKVGTCVCGERIRVPGTMNLAPSLTPVTSLVSSSPLSDEPSVASRSVNLTKRRRVVLLVGFAFIALAGAGSVAILYLKVMYAGSPDKILVGALDTWLLGDYGLQTRDGISFYDDDRIMTHSKLMKYEVTTSRSVDKDKTELSVVLVFESRAHTELRQSKKYMVYRSAHKWKIVQEDPQMREWLKAIKEKSQEGQLQEEGRRAARDLSSGGYRTGFEDDGSLAFRVFELKQRITLGEDAALRKRFRLMREKQTELQGYQAKEDDQRIKEILSQLITGIEIIASAEKAME